MKTENCCCCGRTMRKLAATTSKVTMKSGKVYERHIPMQYICEGYEDPYPHTTKIWVKPKTAEE